MNDYYIMDIRMRYLIIIIYIMIMEVMQDRL